MKILKKLRNTGIVLIGNFLISMPGSSVYADCHSCDGYLDDGKCDKSDIYNKKCVLGGFPADCKWGGCPSGGGGGGY